MILQKNKKGKITKGQSLPQEEQASNFLDSGWLRGFPQLAGSKLTNRFNGGLFVRNTRRDHEKNE
jgi:hypothetical protein